MKKLLCPTDFSQTSYNAITYAAKLAQVVGANLTLLNVQSLYDITPVEFVSGNQFTLKATTERLKTLCEEISRTFGIRCIAEVEPKYNKLSTVIGEKSREYDLLAMGSNGADDLYQFFFGSNAYNALLQARTPVLIIPEGSLYSPISKIIYAFDYLSQRKLPLAPLQNFAEILNAEVTVLQVMEEAVSQEVDDDLTELQFILQTKNPDWPLKFDTIRSSDVAKSIDSYILAAEPDLLALCSQNRGFIESLFHKSVIKNISAIASYPVFVFPE